MADLKLDLQQSFCCTCADELFDPDGDDDEDTLRHSLGSHPTMSGKSLQRALCARRWTQQPCGHFTCCPEAASISCEHCALVQYCSVQCMQEHRECHRKLCESHLLRKTTSPYFRKMDEDLLPDTPTTELAHLPTLSNPSLHVYGLLENAGDDFKRLKSLFTSSLLWYLLPSPYSSSALPGHLRFLFPCAYDLRNSLQTICQIPDGYTGRVTIFINSAKSILAVRDLLILELLRFYGPKGIDMVIALWYSSALTPQQDRAMLLAIRRILYGNQSENTQADSKRGATTVCSYQSSFPSSREGSFMRADFSSDARGILVGMLKDLDARFEPRTQYWERTEEMDDIKNVKQMCALPAHLASWNKYNTSGLLLPFDTLETRFTVPNRVRYCRSLNFITRYSNDVLSGWDILKVISSGVRYGASDHDLYGCLFFHVRQMIQTALQKLKCGCFELCLTQFSPKKLADILCQAQLNFHRIDACSLAHDNTIDSSNGRQDILTMADAGVMSLPGVHALLKKLLALGKVRAQSKPRHCTLPETVQILGRLVEQDDSEEFPRLLLTAVVDWASKDPSAMRFLQEKEGEIKSMQAHKRRRLLDLFSGRITGKWVYSAQLTEPDDAKYICALLDLYSPPRALMYIEDMDKTGAIFHQEHFLPYLQRLITEEEITKMGLENKTSEGLFRILPQNWHHLMIWRKLFHGTSNVDEALGANAIENAVHRLSYVVLYYTVLFSGFTFLEEFQEWGWIGTRGIFGKGGRKFIVVRRRP